MIANGANNTESNSTTSESLEEQSSTTESTGPIQENGILVAKYNLSNPKEYGSVMKNLVLRVSFKISLFLIVIKYINYAYTLFHIIIAHVYYYILQQNDSLYILEFVAKVVGYDITPDSLSTGSANLSNPFLTVYLERCNVGEGCHWLVQIFDMVQYGIHFQNLIGQWITVR